MFCYKLKICVSPISSKSFFQGICSLWVTLFKILLLRLFLKNSFGLTEKLGGVQIFHIFTALCHSLIFSKYFNPFTSLKAQIMVYIFFFSSKVFLTKVHTFFKHNAIAYFIYYSANITFPALENQKIHVTHSIALSILLPWSGTQPTVSLRYACFGRNF